MSWKVRRRRFVRGRSPALIMVLLLVIILPAKATPGWFRPAAGGLALQANDAALGDLDGDGDLDAYLARGTLQAPDFSETPLPDRLMENRSGVLVDAGAGADAASPAAAVAVAIADVDGDGDADVILAGGSVYQGPGGMNVPAPTRIHLNRGSGSLASSRFEPAAQTLSGAVARMAVADIDGDGDPDIALAVAEGRIEVWRNQGGAQAGTAGQFQLAQNIAVGGFQGASALALGNLVGDDRIDLAFAHPTLATVHVHAGVSGVQPFASAATIVLEPGFAPTDPLQPTSNAINDLDIGPLDGFGRDDLVIATTRGAGVFLAAAADQLVAADIQFPAENVETAAIADLDADGRPDIVLGRAESLGSGAIRFVALQGVSEFVPSAQCFGNQFLVRALIAGDVDGDGLSDLLAVGSGGGGAGQPAAGITVYENDAAFGEDACCAAETAAFALAPIDGGARRPTNMIRAIGDAVIDLQAIRVLREESMRYTPDGRRMIERFDQFSAEVSGLLRSDPALVRLGREALALWRDDLLALTRWRGGTVWVDQDEIDAVDRFLLALAGAGTPGLAQMIEDERDRALPLQDYVGMNLDDFRRSVIGFETLFRDGFDD